MLMYARRLLSKESGIAEDEEFPTSADLYVKGVKTITIKKLLGAWVLPVAIL